MSVLRGIFLGIEDVDPTVNDHAPPVEEALVSVRMEQQRRNLAEEGVLA